MDDRSYTIHMPKRWVRVALIVGITALIVAPLTAVATHSFNDVPNDNTFHADIAAIADAGVTKGCNPPANTLYCPNDFVTREQMAAFMNRLGALGPGQTPVVNAATAGNAETLDGLTTLDLRTLMWAQTPDPDSNTFPGSSAAVEINSVDIVTPRSGFLVISGSAYFNNNGASNGVASLRAQLDGSNILVGAPSPGTGQARFKYEADPAATGVPNDDAHLSYTVTIPITAGAHTVSQEIVPGSSNWFYNSAYLTVVFYPDSAGSVDISASTSGAAHPGQGDEGS